MTATARALLRLAHEFGPGVAKRKLALLRALDRAELATAAQVRDLHEALIFIRAYPDSKTVLAAVDRALARFGRRKDLKRHAEALRDSGIAGTPLQYSYYQRTAYWLASRWPGQLHLRWDELRTPEQIEGRLPIFATFAETIGLDELDLELRDWIDRMRGGETDATWLIRRCKQLGLRGPIEEKFFEDMDLEIEIAPSPDGPSRTRSVDRRARAAYRETPRKRTRPDLRAEVERRPLAVREVPPGIGQTYVDMAREAMVTRSRDLDAFAYGDANDVRLIDWEDGLTFAVIGVIPERRLMLEAVYGWLTLQNGVPIGYVLTSALCRSAEIAFNVFETFRDSEAAWVYSRVCATVRALFCVDTFTIYPYQLGDGNDEGLASGAWWFYQKLGFRPKDRGALALMRKELAAMKRRPAHRSSIATLKRLAQHNVFLHLGEERDDVMGLLPNAAIGVTIASLLGEIFGSLREDAEWFCAATAAKLYGARATEQWPPGERLAWRRWGPLSMLLSGVGKWTKAERRALVDVVRKKGGRREQEFVLAFDRHAKLRAALLTLGRAADAKLD